MKYNKFNLTKLILFFLAFALFLTACSGEEESVSDISNEEAESSFETVSEEESEEPQSLDFTLDMALNLLENDRLITDIFLNNALCNRQTVKSVPVAASSHYSDYSVIEKLLLSTYTQTGGVIGQFLAYPTAELPAVSNVDGTTYVFNHIGSEYNDFIKTSTAAVANGKDEYNKIITAQTYAGKELEFNVVYTEGKWRLEQGVYALNPPVAEKFTKQFGYSGIGSFGSFQGDILVIELFVTDASGDFEYGEEDKYHQTVKTAFDRLSAVSSSFGNDVNITYESAYFHHENRVGSRPLDFDIIFAETGFGSLRNFAESNFDLSLYDNYLFVVCMNKDVETSCAFYQNTAETEFYFGERVIIGENAEPAEVCISLLELMGAYDYAGDRCDEYINSLYRVYFPYDIMVSGVFLGSEISPVTAYACGMIDDLDPLYRVFYYQ